MENKPILAIPSLDFLSGLQQLLLPDRFHIQMINILRKQELGNPRIKQPFHFILIMRDIALEPVIEVSLVGMDDKLHSHSSKPGEELQHRSQAAASRRGRMIETARKRIT